MGVDLIVMPRSVRDAVPQSAWPELARARGFQSLHVNLNGVAVLLRYLRALDVAYDWDEGLGAGSPGIKRRFPELTVEQRNRLWEGERIPGVSDERFDAFHAAERAYFRAHADRAGTPAHKLRSNDGWHITLDECADILEATARAGQPPRPEVADGWSEWDGWEQWTWLRQVFDDGMREDGVLVY